MMTRPHFSAQRLLLAGAALFAFTLNASALEPRTWISLDGRTIDAELIRVDGEIVELKNKEGTTLKVPKTSLSYGDLDYIAEYAPESVNKSLGAKPVKVKLPTPAKDMKYNSKLAKKDAGQLQLGELSFRVCETPHFKVFYSKGVDPMDTAELAERLWHDTAFFHASFAAKFRERRMAIFLADTEKDFTDLGEWYVEILTAAGNTEAADSTKLTWDKAGSTGIALPADTAEKNGVLPEASVIRIAGRTQGAKGDPNKGVWGSFRTHVLAGDMIGMQAGGTSSFAKEGQFAIFTGHCYYKEIDLTGATATSILQTDDGKNTSGAGGYDTGKNWSSELKKRIRKGDVKPVLINLFGASRNDAKPDDMALAYSFSKYLQSTPQRHTAYGKLMERISTSHQVPDPDGVAKIYGLEDGKALEKDWIDFVNSGDFR